MAAMSDRDAALQMALETYLADAERAGKCHQRRIADSEAQLIADHDAAIEAFNVAKAVIDIQYPEVTL